MHTRSGANYQRCCVSNFKNVAASDAENTDGENKICFIFQTKIKQMISYDTKLSKSGNRNTPDTLVRGVTHAQFMFY